MARIHIITDAFNPRHNMDTVDTNHQTIGSWVNEQDTDFRGEAWLCIAYDREHRTYPIREEWDHYMLDDDTSIFFMPHVGEGGLIILAVVAVLALIVAIFLLTPPAVADQEQPDPVFDISGEKNQVRVNNPIEDPYGRNKLWPSYGAIPYVRNESVEGVDTNGKARFLFQTLVLGQGEYDVEEVLLNDTDINEFEEVEFTIFEPGTPVAQFPFDVLTAPEVSNLEMFGTEQTEYKNGNDGWLGGFVIVPINREAVTFEIDIELPNGCYDIDPGGVDGWVFEVQFQWAQVDSNGVVTGAWTNVEGSEFDRNGSGLYRRYLRTLSPWRETLTMDAPTTGRFAVRGRRTIVAHPDEDHVSTTFWTGLRAFLVPLVGQTTLFSGLTVIQIKTRASSNTVANKINVLATRKLPIWNGASFDAPVPSRNPVWAMVNILRAPYGGDKPDNEIDLAGLKLLADEADANSEQFDWVFERRSTLWEALKACLVAIRAIPMLQGSVVTATRDRIQTVPTQLFNTENTASGSFTLQRKVFDTEEYDGLQVQYKDELNNWKDQTVLCTIGAQLGTNPRKVTLRGIIDRDKAYELGNWMWGTEKYSRQQITFQTGFEGTIVTYGDLIKVGSDIPKYGLSGNVEKITVDLDLLTTTFDLSEEVNFDAGGTHQITLRDRYGEAVGPFIVTAGADANQVIAAELVDITDIPTGGNHEPPYYIFGPVDLDGKLCRVVEARPAGPDSVRIKAIIEDSRRFDKDGELAPTIDNSDLAPPTEQPDLENLTVFYADEDPDIVRITWANVAGLPDATEYEVDISADGSEWTLAGSPATETLDIASQEFMLNFLSVRVRGKEFPLSEYGNYIYYGDTPTQEPAGFAVGGGDTFGIGGEVDPAPEDPAPETQNEFNSVLLEFPTFP